MNSRAGGKLVILDRDGVINEDSDQYIKSREEWQLIPGADMAIARLNQMGYRVVVATNQSGLARGLFNIRDLNAMHSYMHSKIKQAGGQIDAVFYCPHSEQDACSCRKPAPGLLEAIGRSFKIDLLGVPVVGDSLRDLQAAQSCACQPILVQTGKGLKTLANKGLPANTWVCKDLQEVASCLEAYSGNTE